MSYQVLARKWRPDSFLALVGQFHVVRALVNALDRQQLHHAYLFTGTRGVGKTTLGRILAKCLNCESGITSRPCNQCQSCQEITDGRFIDLIEVDAASRTRVEDTRELLENVPYAPTSGRFKVYLIDEVHMLSTHSFNALLKTLEEPPPHVKFFLATTDPQKLPITVLSRCLQFHLKCLSPEQITERLAYILTQEAISFETEALSRLAYAAEGSMRDALSLLDQAIAFGNGTVATSDIKLMLGTIEAKYIFTILEALVDQQATPLIATTQQLAEDAIDFSHTLEELITALHQIAIIQLIPEADLGLSDKTVINHFAKLISPQDVQLFYQIALIGRKDLPLAPTARMGLEMTLLRMLAFHPGQSATKISTQIKTAAQSETMPPVVVQQPPSHEGNHWQEIVPRLNLNGISAAIAKHCVLVQMTNEEVILKMDPAQSVLLNAKQEARLQDALTNYFKRPIQLTIQTGQTNMATPAAQEQQVKSKLKSAATESIQQDPNVQKLLETFNAKILPDSIEANDT